MKRLQLVLLAAACSLCLASSAAAQLGGMNFFSKPNIADIFKPVVGQEPSTKRLQKVDRAMRSR